MFSLLIYIFTCVIGLSMGILYKRSITTAQIFNPDPKRFQRVFYILLLSLSVLIFCAFAWLMFKLTKVDIAEVGKIEFNNMHQLLLFVVNLSFLVLVLLSNVYSQSLRRVAIAPYLSVMCFYMFFILYDAFKVFDFYVRWQGLVMNLNITGYDLDSHHKNGITKSLMGFGTVVFNAVCVWWGLRK